MEKPAERHALTPTLPSPDESGVVCLEDLIRLGGGVPTVSSPKEALFIVSTPLSGDGLDLPAERLFASPIADERRTLAAGARQMASMAAALLFVVGAAGAAAQFYESFVPPTALTISSAIETTATAGGLALSGGAPMGESLLSPDAPAQPPRAVVEPEEAVIVARAVVALRPARSSSAPAQIHREGSSPAPAIEAAVEAERAPLAGSFGALLNGQLAVEDSSALSPTPTRAQVRAGLRPATTRVLACGGPSGAVVEARVVIDGPSGRVQRVTVLGELSGSGAACIEREVARSRFEPFAASDFEVGYPFRL